MHSISCFHRLFASVGNAVKILLRWATWCRRAFVIVMPKRGKKGAVAEDGEEPKTGKRIDELFSLEAAMGVLLISWINGKYGPTHCTFAVCEEVAATVGSQWVYS